MAYVQNIVVERVYKLFGPNRNEALRLLVLWLTLAGAVAASRADRHVSISLLDRLLEGRALAAARVATHGFTAGV